jgi:hypothetical protein
VATVTQASRHDVWRSGDSYENYIGLLQLVTATGLAKPEVTPIEIATTFQDFDDFWRPFTLGAGPAPGYCASLGTAERESLKEKLRADLPVCADGSIALKARAWAVRGRKH